MTAFVTGLAGERCAEIKVLSSSSVCSAEGIRQALKGLAYSIRGNHDSAFRGVLLIEASRLEDLARSVTPGKLIEDYWDEFSWNDDLGRFHHGGELIQLWTHTAEDDEPRAALARYLETGEGGDLFGVLAHHAGGSLVRCANLGPVAGLYVAPTPYQIYTDETVYLGPGNALYAFLVAAKHSATPAFRLTLQRKSRWLPGTTMSDRYVLWRTSAQVEALRRNTAIPLDSAPVLGRPDGKPLVCLL